MFLQRRCQCNVAIWLAYNKNVVLSVFGNFSHNFLPFKSAKKS